jgi:hypothetical protein
MLGAINATKTIYIIIFIVEVLMVRMVKIALFKLLATVELMLVHMVMVLISAIPSFKQRMTC